MSSFGDYLITFYWRVADTLSGLRLFIHFTPHVVEAQLKLIFFFLLSLVYAA